LNTMKTEHDTYEILYRTGYYSSLFLTIITVFTFGFAITAVPISGVFCKGNCIEYPYLNTLSQFPGDYIWMYLAVFMILTYLVYTVSIHSFAAIHVKIYSRIGLTFAIISAVVLLSCYFIQFAVIPVSLVNKETDGIALITQYNPHGIFIAMEELGYLLMSFSFLFIGFVFIDRNRIQKSIRLIFIAAFILTIISFSWILIKYGIMRDYRFEIIVISINWMVLVINGVLTGIVFKRALNKQINDQATA
jgi:hypothetical protein